MANQYKMWKEEYTTIVMKILQEGKPFSVKDLQGDIEMAPSSIRKHLKLLAEGVGLRLVGLYSKGGKDRVHIHSGNTEEINDEIEERIVEEIKLRDTQKFMCKCKVDLDGSIVWISAKGLDKEGAKEELRRVYKGIPVYKGIIDILEIYDMKEYSKVRMPRDAVGRAGTIANSMSHKMGMTHKH